jgi:hypothetical protein
MKRGWLWPIIIVVIILLFLLVGRLLNPRATLRRHAMNKMKRLVAASRRLIHVLRHELFKNQLFKLNHYRKSPSFNFPIIGGKVSGERKTLRGSTINRLALL